MFLFCFYFVYYIILFFDLFINMATTPCFQHESCDGTDYKTRIDSYYTCNGYEEERRGERERGEVFNRSFYADGLGENIAAGNTDPIATSIL